MTRDGPPRCSLPWLPADLAAIVALTVLAGCFALAPVLRATPLRVPLGLAFVFLAPGYAVVAAVFPRGSDRNRQADSPPVEDGADPQGRRTITGAERLALSVASSALLASLVGVGLTFASVDVALLPIVVALSLLTVAATALAAYRRAKLPPSKRLSIDVSLAGRDGLPLLRHSDSRGDRLLDAALIALVLLAVVGVGYAALGPGASDGYTELAVLTENESGALVADDYPETVAVGEQRNLTLAVDNHEETAIEYTAVAQLQYVAAVNGTGGDDGPNATRSAADVVRVEERVELDRYSHRLPADDRWTRPHSIAAPRSGERVRLVYLLYRGDVPASPTIENAEKEVHLWLEVTS